MRARDIMSSPVYTVRTSDTVVDAAALLADKQITAAPVLDPEGRLVGMVSEGDLLWHRVLEDPTAHARRIRATDEDRPRLVEQVMTGYPVAAWPEADLADIAAMMLRHGVRSIPLLDDHEQIGRRDILRTVLRTDDVLRDEVQHRLDAYAAGRWTATVKDGVATIDGDLPPGQLRDADALDDVTRRLPRGLPTQTGQPREVLDLLGYPHPWVEPTFLRHVPEPSPHRLSDRRAVPAQFVGIGLDESK